MKQEYIRETEVVPEVEKLEIEFLIEEIYRCYGLDFRNYVTSSLRRRIWYRIFAENLNSISQLLALILHDSQAMDRLFRAFSINVTEMFRDQNFFKSFRINIVPLLRSLPYIRIWHAGCSTGEEAYSMAILLHEEGLLHKTRIYATDMNEAVLKQAKTGTFPIQKMKLYTKNYLAAGGRSAFSEYYKACDHSVAFHAFLKEPILFAQHNLATDRSFNEFHVIICRNVLIYFNKYLQEQVHQLFFDSLAPSGILGLGNKEEITFTHLAKQYITMDAKEKIYQKKGKD